MTTFRGVRAFAAAAILLVALTSCSDDADEPGAAPPPTPTSQSPTASPSDEPSASPSEKAAKDAEAKVREYYALVDLLRQEPKRSAKRLEAVASSVQLTAQKAFLAGQRKAGNRQVGDTKVVEVKVQSVALDELPTVVVDVCWDVSDGDVLNRQGESIVSPDRKSIGWTQLYVTNYSWDKDPEGGWRVAGGSDLEKAPCTAS